MTSIGNKEAAITFTAQHYQNIYTSINDPLMGHFNLKEEEWYDQKTYERQEIQSYCDEIAISLIEELKQVSGSKK